jgi:hypothetical protein
MGCLRFTGWVGWVNVGASTYLPRCEHAFRRPGRHPRARSTPSSARSPRTRRPDGGHRRRRHRQDARDHPPHRLWRQFRCVCRAPRAGPHLHRARRRRDAHPPCASLGVAGVQARTFHAAALRQLHYFWPHAVGGAAPEVLPSQGRGRRRGRRPAAAALRPHELRDFAAEIEWAKVGMLTPETYAAAATRAARTPPGLDLTAMARLMRPTRMSRPSAASSTSRTSCC